VHHDERSAAFMALGLGLASGRPALVLTTSGTAAVELHPAVVEAHEAKVPLLVCTADRPPELHGVGAPQTVDQQQLYGTSVRLFVDPGVPDPSTSSSWRSIASEAYLRAVDRPPGPVHLNLPFRDPLVGTAGPQPAGRGDDAPWHRPVVRSDAVPMESLDALVTPGARGIIVAGGGIDDPDGVHDLSRALGWPVLADPRSGARVPAAYTVSHFDEILRVDRLADQLRPDIVLRLGSLPASKVLGQWLAGLDAWQVGIDQDGTRYDPDRCLDGLILAPPGSAASELARSLAGPSVERDRADDDLDLGGGLDAGSSEGWAGLWAHADAVAAEAIATVLAGHGEPTEPAVARDVVRALPDGAALVVSSSMPIRDVEWYAAPTAGLQVLANRGANGIDGVVSTAVGVALARRRPGRSGRSRLPTALLIGDVAFLHDTNGLLGAARRGIDLTIVLVDNDGGGIFSFLPQAAALDRPEFEHLYGTPHGVDLPALIAAHGVSCRVIERQLDVAPAVVAATKAGGVHVILVRTDRQANVVVHDEIHAAVTAALC
ncbi:MAG: 2-succinyl-5-enolpyruvyl-6-hydroxy-3-cyclohexene-1-carboxylic-acid synthase, partial [Acidimicrobiales bacterium]